MQPAFTFFYILSQNGLAWVENKSSDASAIYCDITEGTKGYRVQVAAMLTTVCVKCRLMISVGASRELFSWGGFSTGRAWNLWIRPWMQFIHVSTVWSPYVTAGQSVLYDNHSVGKFTQVSGKTQWFSWCYEVQSGVFQRHTIMLFRKLKE